MPATLMQDFAQFIPPGAGGARDARSSGLTAADRVNPSSTS